MCKNAPKASPTGFVVQFSLVCKHDIPLCFSFPFVSTAEFKHTFRYSKRFVVIFSVNFLVFFFFFLTVNHQLCNS